jgi:hypothetical protein
MLTPPDPPSVLSRAPHPTGATAHGQADILAYHAGSGAGEPAHRDGATRGIAECGKYDTHARTPSRLHDAAWTPSVKRS